ncbi:MAG: hypothetical protein AB1792_10955 [Candidatus Zixiibacteriota bacterium]
MRRDLSRLLGLWLSPLGAVTAVICFFLPWVRFSCLGIRRTMSGADLGGVLWVVPVLCIAVVMVSLLRVWRPQGLPWTQFLVAAASLGALAVLVLKYMSVARYVRAEYGTITAEDVGLHVHTGAWGILVSLLVCLIGSLVPRSRPKAATSEVPETSADVVSVSSGNPDRAGPGR